MAGPALSLFESAVWAEASRHQLDLSRLIQRFADRDDQRVAIVAETVFTNGGDPLDELSYAGVREVARVLSPGGAVVHLRDDEGEWLLLSVSTDHEGVFQVLAAVPRTDSRWQRVKRWISNASGVSRCYLNHDDFAEIGDKIAAYGQVEVVKVSARMVRDGSSVNRGFPRGDTDRPSHRDAIAEIEGLGATVRTLTLHVADTLDIHLRRVAGATFYGGHYPTFRDIVLRRLAAAAAARRDLLSGRERKSADEKPRPLTIALPESFLKNADDTGDVLDAIGEIADVTLAVFHRNPYLHFAVSDEIDGSNFDVLVTREDAIDIYPGFRSTPASLARVSQKLGEVFGAVTIEERPQSAPVSVYDLV